MSDMKPDVSKITIKDNKRKIVSFLSEAIFAPRTTMMKWAKLTNQTPNLKIGYPGQHLASLITGMKGTATGARGDDIVDGTEVKSCSRVDQVDKCLSCDSNVMRSQSQCPKCGSVDIKRNNDSKWLISIHSEKELDLYLSKIPRMLFIISDYPNFDNHDFSTIRFASYEIWNQSQRAKSFRELLNDYYRKIYLVHTLKDRNKTPAPKNFWPYSLQFYMCNPIKTFECIVSNADTMSPKIDIHYYIEPGTDRSNLKSEDMPISLLNKKELSLLANKGIDINSTKVVTEDMRQYLSLRDTSRAMPQMHEYSRS